MAKIAICRVPNCPGSSGVPTFKTMAGKPGGRVTIWVPHSARNSRVTARSRSLRANFFHVALV